jgi:hypothetical protein
MLGPEADQARLGPGQDLVVDGLNTHAAHRSEEV